MARTAVFSACLGLIFVWNWARIEEPRASIGPMLLMVLLGTAPALLPTFRWRLGAAGVALLVAGAIALDVSRPWSLGKLAGRAGNGFLDFYDVLVPFDAVAHPLMHGVVLLAVFLFTALAGLAVAARRPLLAGLVLVAGAGWPATILPGNDDLGRGAFVLAAVLALVAWLRPEERRAPPQILVGIGIVVVALLASSSGAVAKGQFVDWENWDFYNKPGKPRQRRVRLALELRRHRLPEGADTRLHGPGARTLRLLARDDARRVRGRPLGRGPVRDLLGGPAEPRHAHRRSAPAGLGARSRPAGHAPM